MLSATGTWDENRENVRPEVMKRYTGRLRVRRN